MKRTLFVAVAVAFLVTPVFAAEAPPTLIPPDAPKIGVTTGMAQSAVSAAQAKAKTAIDKIKP